MLACIYSLIKFMWLKIHKQPLRTFQTVPTVVHYWMHRDNIRIEGWARRNKDLHSSKHGHAIEILNLSSNPFGGRRWMLSSLLLQRSWLSNFCFPTRQESRGKLRGTAKIWRWNIHRKSLLQSEQEGVNCFNAPPFKQQQGELKS